MSKQQIPAKRGRSSGISTLQFAYEAYRGPAGGIRQRREKFEELVITERRANTAEALDKIRDILENGGGIDQIYVDDVGEIAFRGSGPDAH